MSDSAPNDFTRDLVRWSESLAAIARTGLGFTESLYERERFEEILHVAADIKAAADEALEVRRERDHFVQEWMESVGEGVPGYVTPKVAVGAVVGNEAGEILLVGELTAESVVPDGLGRCGYSPSESCQGGTRRPASTATRCIARVIDGQGWFTRFAMFAALHCTLPGATSPGIRWKRRRGGSSATSCHGSAGANWWGPMAFAAIDGHPRTTCSRHRRRCGAASRAE